MFSENRKKGRPLASLLLRLSTVTALSIGVISGTSDIFQLQPMQLVGSPTPATLYVSQSGTDSTTCGTSGTNACKTIARAIANATSGDTIDVGASSSANPFNESVTIDKNLTIIGQGASSTFVGGTSTTSVSGSVFTVNSGVIATVTGMTVQYGQTGIGGGGGIFNSGTLTATNDTIYANFTNSLGGGIFNSGTLIATNDTISGNTAGNTAGSGGGIFNGGTLTATDDTISGNTASAVGGTVPVGGGIFNGGTLTATDDTISGNTAFFGGGIFNLSHFTLAASIIADQISGGNCSGTITDAGYNITDDTSCGLSTTNHSIIESSTLTLPTLANNGGPTQTILPGVGSPALGIVPVNTSVTINSSSIQLCPTTDQRGVASNPATACDAGSVQVVPNLYATATPTTSVACSLASPCSLTTALSDATPGSAINLVTPGTSSSSSFYSGNFTIATPNTSSTEQVTIHPLAGVTNPILDGANSGTVLTVNAAVFATVDGVTIQNGDSPNRGGGIINVGTLTVTNSTISGNIGLYGGGISNGGTLIATNDTISNNTIVGGTGAGDGGGISNSGLGEVTATNDTISGNSAPSTYGGGIGNYGNFTATNDSISGNAGLHGGGIFNSGNLTAAATIIADQISGGNCFAATITSSGYDVTDDTTCGLNAATDVVNTSSFSNPVDLLGPLANNGGPTLTIAPEHGNPAVGLIPVSATVSVNGTNIELCPTTDQRGIASASGNSCNAGSVQGSPQQITFAPPSAGTVGSSANLSATGGNSNNPVIFSVDPSSTPGACSITANTVTFTGSGSCVIDANQQGDQSYLAAPTVQKTITVQMAPSIPLAVPASPTVNGPSSVSSNSVTITWTPSTNPGYSPATSYEVFEGTAPNKESNTPVTCSTPLTSSSTSCTITGLNPSTTYYFYVVATDTAGSSTASNEISITTSTTTTTPQSPSKISTPGYLLAGSDGGVFTYGSANFYGSTANMTLNKPIVGVASTPDGKGYWLVAADGGVFAFGDANYYGSLANTKINQPIVGVASTPDGKGYWLAASDGGVFAFGDANYYGSTVDKSLNKPIVGIASTTDGKGYWLAASDGGVFAFGDANYYGSTANMTLNKPIAGITATSDGKGYWLVAADGGVFSFGDATYLGSAADLKLKRAVDSVASVAVAG